MLIIKTKRKRRAGGIHTDYIIDILELCKSEIQSSQLVMTTKMCMKATTLKLIRWLVATELIEKRQTSYTTFYTTTEKGREFQEILSLYEQT